jgi:hypothetical protein
MSLGRIVKTNGKFEFVELDETEQVDVINEVISKNLAIFSNCVETTYEFMKKWYPFQVDDKFMDVALAIFNAVAIKGFTVLDTELRKKISAIKENGSK